MKLSRNTKKNSCWSMLTLVFVFRILLWSYNGHSQANKHFLHLTPGKVFLLVSLFIYIYLIKIYRFIKSKNIWRLFLMFLPTIKRLSHIWPFFWHTPTKTHFANTYALCNMPLSHKRLAIFVWRYIRMACLWILQINEVFFRRLFFYKPWCIL